MRVTLASDGSGQVKLAAGTAEIGKLAAGTAEIGKLAAGVAEIGNVKNAGTFATQATLQAGTAEFGKLAAGVAEIGQVKNSGTFATQATLQAGTAEFGKLATGTAEIGNVKNAGTFIVQEDGAALTALQLIDDTVYVDDADWTDGSSKHLLVGGLFQSTPQSITDGDVGPVQVDSNGNLIVALSATDNTVLDNIDTSLNNIEAAVGGTHIDDAAFTPGTDDGVPIFAAFDDTTPDSVDEGDAGIVRMSANRNLYGTIRDAAGNERGANVTAGNALNVSSVVTGAALTALQLIDNAVVSDAGTYTDGSSSGMGCFGVHQATPDTVADDDFSPILLNSTAGQMVELQASSASIGVVDLGANNDVTISAAGTGGMSYKMLGIAAEDNDVVIKASAATVYFISVQSIDATPVYLKLFDLASFTPGTDTADLQFLCPAAATAANAAGIVLNFSPGIQFANGLCALISTGFALDANTAVSASEVIITIGYE